VGEVVDDGVLHIEVVAAEPGVEREPGVGRLPPGASLVSRPLLATAIAEVAPADLTRVLERISGAIASSLKESRPDDCSVEFGVTFKGTAGLPAIASGEATTNLKVTMTWRRTTS
jgi:hypothetical protein